MGSRRSRSNKFCMSVAFMTVALLLVGVSSPAQAAGDPDLALFNPNNGQWTVRYGDGHWYGDIANLDGDADGEPCESLPGAP